MPALGAAELAQIQQGLTDQQKMIFMSQFNSEKKDPGIVLVVSIVGGFMGVDRFYIGDVGVGILKFLTLGLCGILTIYDWFTIRGRTEALNREKANEIATAIKTSS